MSNISFNCTAQAVLFCCQMEVVILEEVNWFIFIPLGGLLLILMFSVGVLFRNPFIPIINIAYGIKIGIKFILKIAKSLSKKVYNQFNKPK